MTHPIPIPSRGPETADRMRPVVPLHGAPQPVDPAQLLPKSQTVKDPRKSKVRIALMIGAVLLAAQVLAPPPLRPMAIAGQAAADFYWQIMVASQRNGEVAAHQTGLAQKLADLEGRHSEAMAKCGFVGMVSPEAFQLCAAVVDQNFMPVIIDLRQKLNQ